MRMLRLACVGSCSLAILGAVLAARAAAEPVQTSFTVDANTTALWLFKEGTGTTSANAVSGAPAATFYGANWVMGRQYYAVATDSGYVDINDGSAVRPATAITVEVWAKLQQPGGYLACKNGSYLLTVGRNVSAEFSVGNGWQAVSGTLPISMGQWTHIAITYDSATKQAAIYVNGVLDTKTTLTGGSTLQGYGSTLRLGLNDWNPMGSQMDGKIDSLRISKVARSFDPIPTTPPPVVRPPGNLVPNGDFELGLNGWHGSNYGDIALCWETTTGAATGLKCMHALPAAWADFQGLRVPLTPPGLYSRPIPVNPGGNYTLSFQMKASAQVTVRVELDRCGGALGLGWAGPGYTIPPYFSPFPIYPTINTSWKKVTQSFTVPTNIGAPNVSIQFQYPSSGQLWIDDVEILANVVPNGLTLKDKVGVAPQTLPVGNVFIAGQASPVTLNVVNTDTVAHNVAIQPTIVDWETKKLSGVPSLGTVNVPAKSTATKTYNINTSRRGSFVLGFDLTSENQTWHQSTKIKYVVFVNMQNVGNADTSIFAMNTHQENEPSDHLAREMQVLSISGVKWIRAWWGWGMCENPQGTFNFTEYDRQFNAVTSGTGMRIMPILLRYTTPYEQSWAGPVTSGAIQEYPYASMLPEWTVWVGKVAQHYAGQIKAYELWNEPTMGSSPNGVLTSQQYATLLNDTTPALRQYDPNAKLVAFAGTPLTGTTNASVQGVLALGTAAQMDAISEHSYSQTMLPEINYPLELKTGSPNLTSIMQAGGASGKEIWHSEQGIQGDNDGYGTPAVTEADVAQYYVRNIITATSLGSKHFFWFSSDNPPATEWGIYYENYVPRPRLAALNACASFIEGSPYQKSYTPTGTTVYAHLFKGTNAACVIWNTSSAMSVVLNGLPAAKVQAFDTMGNPLTVTGTSNATVQLAQERPAYLQVALADYNLLDSALAAMQVTAVSAVTIKASPVTGGVQVTLTGASSSPADGVVDLIPAAATTPVGWPAAQRFQGLALGQSQTFRFTLPNKAAVSQVRVRCGDRRLVEVRVPYSGR